jgi:hypothetical protein
MDVISITVKSEAVNTFREFNTDKQAEKYVRTINRLHMAHRMQIAGPKPKKLRGKGSVRQNISNLFILAIGTFIMHSS